MMSFLQPLTLGACQTSKHSQGMTQKGPRHTGLGTLKLIGMPGENYAYVAETQCSSDSFKNSQYLVFILIYDLLMNFTIITALLT